MMVDAQVSKQPRKERHLNWEIEPWLSFAFHRNPGPADFRVMRQCLRFSQARCAELLGVYGPLTVRRWENGTRPVPSMAYHMLRLLLESKHFTLRHEEWNGWQVGRDGKLYAQGGRYSFQARELEAWWIRSQQIRALEKHLEETRAALATMEAENTKLRELFVKQGVVGELADMRVRLGELWSRLNTAQVIPMPAAAPKKRAAARSARGR